MARENHPSVSLIAMTDNKVLYLIMRLKLPKKPRITAKEWERISEEADAAKALLEDPRFSFPSDYLKNAQPSCCDSPGIGESP